MKKIILFLFLMNTIFVFSQSLEKAIKVMDSVNIKYPSRSQEMKDILEIYSLSDSSKDAVNNKIKNKLSKYELKDLKKSYVDNVINYYQMNYLWLITDKIFSNFNKEEVVILKKLIKKKKRDTLLDKYINIEQDCIKHFDKNFE